MVFSPGPTGRMVKCPVVPALSISLLNMFYKIKIIKFKKKHFSGMFGDIMVH